MTTTTTLLLSDDERPQRLTALRPELHRYCARLMGSVIDGEDVVQDAYIRALGALPALDPNTPLRPWLFRIAHNRALDLLRARSVRRAEPMEAAYGVAAAIPDADDALASKDALRMAFVRFLDLSIPQRSVVILKDVLGESLAFIAGLLDLSVDAVKGHLARARARLRAMPAPSPAMSRPIISPEVARYIDLFNDRDWDALRAMLARDAKLQQSAMPLRTGPTTSEFFSIYGGYGDIRLAPAWLEGRQVIAVFEGPSPEPHHIMWLSWTDGLIDFIRDYRYIPYMLAETQLIVDGHG